MTQVSINAPHKIDDERERAQLRMIERIEDYAVKRTEPTAQLNINISDRPDSVDIGTPSRGGNAKVYFNAERPAEARKLIESIIKLRVFAQQEMDKAVLAQVGATQ